VEFITVELVGGVELTALVEKTVAGSVEKPTTGLHAGEARGGREVWWRGRKMGCLALAQRCDGEGGVVEREVRWRAPSPRRHGRGKLSQRCDEVSFFFSFLLQRLGTSRQDAVVGLLRGPPSTTFGSTNTLYPVLPNEVT
jgi:hypothetical protein